MLLRQSPTRTANERRQKRKFERAERKAKRNTERAEKKAKKKEAEKHEIMESAVDEYAEQERILAEENEKQRRAHTKEVERQRLEHEKLRGLTPKQLGEIKRRKIMQSRKEEMKRMEEAEIQENERKEAEKQEEREAYRKELDDRKARRDEEIEGRLGLLDEASGIVKEDGDPDEDVEDDSDDADDDSEEETEEDIEEDADDDRESVICPHCGEPIDMKDPKGHIIVNGMPTCIKCANRLMGLPEDSDAFENDIPMTLNDDDAQENTPLAEETDPGKDGKGESEDAVSALDILNSNVAVMDETTDDTAHSKPNCNEEDSESLPDHDALLDKDADNDNDTDPGNVDADDNGDKSEDEDSDVDGNAKDPPSIVPPYRREKKKEEESEDDDDDTGNGSKKRGRKKKKNYSPDPDSPGERFRRWKLIHFENYVILRTLYRDDKTGEFVRESTLIPRKELPHDAVACTGEKHIYCLDLIKDSEWYYRNHYKNINLLEYQFTASDAALYMQSNKIDNALAVHWVTPSNTKDILKWVLLGIGVLIVAWLLMSRLGGH